MYKLTGTVKVINDTVQISDKFAKREFVVTDTSSMYPQDVLFQLTQDKCGLIDNIKVSETVEVSFNLRGREWTNPQGEVKYFNSLEAWRIEKVGQTSGSGIPQGGPSEMNLNPTPSPIESATEADDSDDLPF